MPVSILNRFGCTGNCKSMNITKGLSLNRLKTKRYCVSKTTLKVVMCSQTFHLIRNVTQIKDFRINAGCTGGDAGHNSHVRHRVAAERPVLQSQHPGFRGLPYREDIRQHSTLRHHHAARLLLGRLKAIRTRISYYCSVSTRKFLYIKKS